MPLNPLSSILNPISHIPNSILHTLYLSSLISIPQPTFQIVASCSALNPSNESEFCLHLWSKTESSVLDLDQAKNILLVLKKDMEEAERVESRVPKIIFYTTFLLLFCVCYVSHEKNY